MSTDGWETTQLGEVVDILDSKRVPVNSEERAKRTGDVPYYGATGRVGWIDAHLFDEELVLLGEDGAPFLDSAKPKAYMIRGKAWVNNHAHVLRARPGFSNSFIQYQLNTIDYRPFVSGTTRLKLPQGPMRLIPLRIAPFPEQRRIVAEIEKQFTRLDAGVAALRRAQANLKRYRASVLKAACEGKLVPTEAVLARAEGREYESGAALLERILVERRTTWAGRGKYKEPAAPHVVGLPGLPEMPEGWCWATVEQLGEVQLGRQRSPKHVSKDYPTKYIRAANITNAGLSLDDVLEMEFGLAEQERYRLQHGDIVLSEASGSASQVGKPAMWRDELPLCCFQNTVIRLRPVLIGSTYVLTAFQHFYTNGVFSQIAGGVGINHLGAEKFSAIPFPVPPLAEQQRIVAEVERRLSVIDELEAVVVANLQRAARLRRAVLQRAFAGEL